MSEKLKAILHKLTPGDGIKDNPFKSSHGGKGGKDETDGSLRYSLLIGWVTLIVASVIVTAVALVFAAANIGGDIYASYFYCPLIFLMNFLPVMLFMAFLWYLTRRLWIGFIITSVLTLSLSLGNYFKIDLRDDPLLFSDLGLLNEAGKMAGRYSVAPSVGMILAFLLVIGITVAMAYLVKGRTKSVKLGLIGALVLGLLTFVFVRFVIINDTVYGKVANSSGEFNPANATELYESKGIVYPFLHSVIDILPHKVSGYSDETAEDILAEYSYDDIPEDKKVNVIGIMLEAFNDFSKYDEIDFVSDPYDIYKEIKAQSYCGHLITNIFAGGTVDTERCFLTGDIDYGTLDEPTQSYVRYFNDQGYYCWGTHPSYQWFYDRDTIDANLGFEDYWFYENRYKSKLMTGSSEIAQDVTFMSDLYNMYEDYHANNNNDYSFSFSVTYQNHGPYYDFMLGATGKYVSDKYSDESYAIANNYFTGVRNTTQNLKRLMTKLEADDEPVILVFFGDHNPWMGDDKSVYKEFGINLDASTREGYLNTYETDYVIWANTAAKEKLGNDFVGTGPDIGPNFLMNVLFEQCGWKGNEYLKFTDSVREYTPMLAKLGYYVTDDSVVKELTGTAAEKVRDYEIVQYYEKYRAEIKPIKEHDYTPPSPADMPDYWAIKNGTDVQKTDKEETDASDDTGKELTENGEGGGGPEDTSAETGSRSSWEQSGQDQYEAPGQEQPEGSGNTSGGSGNGTPAEPSGGETGTGEGGSGDNGGEAVPEQSGEPAVI